MSKTKPNYYLPGAQDVISFCHHHNLDFCAGNVIKYVTRAGKKSADPIADLNKAKEYIDRMIQRHESNSEPKEEHGALSKEDVKRVMLDTCRCKRGVYDHLTSYNVPTQSGCSLTFCGRCKKPY